MKCSQQSQSIRGKHDILCDWPVQHNYEITRLLHRTKASARRDVGLSVQSVEILSILTIRNDTQQRTLCRFTKDTPGRIRREVDFIRRETALFRQCYGGWGRLREPSILSLHCDGIAHVPLCAVSRTEEVGVCRSIVMRFSVYEK